MSENSVQNFLSAVSETPHLWQSVDMRLIALQVDGMWHNLVARFLLDPRSPNEVFRPRDFPQLPYFSVIQEVFRPEDLADLIEKVRSGSLDVQGKTVQFLTSESGRPFTLPYRSSYERIGRQIADVIRGRYTQGHSLTLSGDEAGTLYRLLPREEEGLNAALRGLPDPWDGVAGVLLHALDESATLPSHSNRRVHFVAPLSAQIVADDCILADDELTYTVVASSKLAGESCTVIITGIDMQGGRVARRVSLARRRWKRVGPDFHYTGREPFKGARRLAVTLRVASFEIGRTEVDDRTERTPLLLSAYDALFPKKRNFVPGLLQSSRKDSRSFEWQVALLLIYCGIPIEYIGDGPDTQEAPDILAQIPGTPIVLIVEITVGPLNQKGKLARLTQRTNDVRTSVEPSGGVVLPVIVTANSPDAIAQNELDAARADGIRVLSKDDLQILLQMAMRRTPIRHVARYLAPDLAPETMGVFWGLRERNRFAELE